VFVAGHRGLVGGAILRELHKRGCKDVLIRAHSDLDLRDQGKVRQFFQTERPQVVYLAAARVGGIHANNSRRWDFLRENLEIQTSVIGSSLDTDVKRLVFFGSSCIYPRLSKQPIKEEYLLTGPLEPTNEPYAVAKIAGLKLVEAANRQHGKKWVSLMPTNLYGPGDNFDLETSHVLPAMLRKFHEARIARENGEDAVVGLWGTGKALREFLYVEDLARAACDVAESDCTGLFNVGYGSEVSIAELAEIIARVVEYDGPIAWDATRGEGAPRKLLDSQQIRAKGWSPEVSLEQGIRLTYEWFRLKSPVATTPTTESPSTTPRSQSVG
jgi:GDP-L-fucose synthase